MNWIKDFTLGLISIFISYSLLIAGDWYIQKNIIQQLKHNSEYSEAKKIEEKKRVGKIIGEAKDLKIIGKIEDKKITR